MFQRSLKRIWINRLNYEHLIADNLKLQNLKQIKNLEPKNYIIPFASFPNNAQLLKYCHSSQSLKRTSQLKKANHTRCSSIQ